MHTNPSRSLRILIADDDEDDRALIAMAFQEVTLPHTIQFFKDGEELMDHLSGISRSGDSALLPDLILLDLNMPKKDGRVALKEIKENPTLNQLNVIIFSTSISEMDKQYALRLGASDYITKPPGFFQLVETMKKICSSIPVA